MKKWMLYFTCLLTWVLTAQKEQLFDAATSAYNEGKYEVAAENYLKILEQGQHSASLYFNLGNCYYKLNQIAPSIYYYEKALLLDPDDVEIRNNLGYAQNMTLDDIEALQSTGISKITNDITGKLTFDQWSYAAVAFMLLFVAFYILYYYLRYATQKRLAFIVSIVSLFLSLCAVLFAYLQYSNYISEQPAIVFAEEVAVKSEPNNRSQDTFVLHEGTKIQVLEELNDWKKIALADGSTGWLKEDAIKMLKDF